MKRELINQIYKDLRALIAIPSLSSEEGAVIEAIKRMMQDLDFDEIKIDGMGNILGRVGSGKRIMAFDGHIDTVDVGNPKQWTFDPFTGKEDETHIFGRGASDQTGGFVSAMHAAALAKKMDLLNNWQVWVVGSVQEEDCDGLCWQYILNEGVLTPEFVVLTEPTSLRVYRGHRGRMEIRVSVDGISAHGSAPERGDNAIYKMAKIIDELDQLNGALKPDDFLGKGTLVVSEIFSTAPSRCAVADGCSISIDRRLTAGETADTAIGEIEALKGAERKVEMYRYNKPSYKGYVPDVPCYFPTWTIPENHGIVRAMETAHYKIQGQKPSTDKWTFSTNGVSIMGMKGIPCVGYGPGDEAEAHAPNEKIRKLDLVQAVETYMAFISELEEGTYV
ncbi:YgeY family selenium metabolism-linked hydrolase [Fusibacter tunisiensis]|uniref:Selenium metabolism hydrolase n=1 Tax=Fusibacter tunisiensis TaxID=1008308 RepID=A0ABS2MQQ0_9FIRM|nr:YgeY family selenium metabolism-linked hydrolase [Fusibacter tunisiensis]MBM7561731.1 putative selenium metabolism hydrolase [Fusibacter tunisiensis]